MSRPLDIGLDQIKTLLLKMGKLSQDAIYTALDGFHSREDVHVQTRALSNTLLILSEEVEDVATEMIALHQPMAGDLRTLKAYIKIAYDMERYGRYAMDISDILLRLGEWAEYEDVKLTIKEMGEKVLVIVATSIKLIDTMDEKLVWELSKAEAEIDEFYLRNLSELINYEGEDHKTIIANLLTIRYLERIADHASYIAESITYAVTGKRLELR
jgi:phosphate transport system protein